MADAGDEMLDLAAAHGGAWTKLLPQHVCTEVAGHTMSKPTTAANPTVWTVTGTVMVAGSGGNNVTAYVLCG